LPIEIQLDGDRRVLTNEKLCTSLPNIWAIGAVRAGGNGLLSDAMEDASLVFKNIINQ
jgi:thioredoxin reductase (NADPH)